MELTPAQTIMAAQIPIVFFLMLFSWHAYKSLKIQLFFYVFLGFVFNLGHILLNFSYHFITIPDWYRQVFQVSHLAFNFTISYLFYAAAVFDNAADQPVFPRGLSQKTAIGLIATLFIITALWYSLPDENIYWPITGNWHFDSPALISCTISFLALFSLSLRFKEQGYYYLWYGFLGYAVVQFLALLSSPIETTEAGTLVSTGYFLSLIFKMVILYGLHRLFVDDAKKKAEVEKINSQLDQIMGETFHEITAPLRSMYGRLNELSNGHSHEIKMSNKAREKVEGIEENYNRVIAVVSGYMKIYQNKMAKTFDEELFLIPRDDHMGGVSPNNLNTLIEIAIISLKDLKKNDERINFSREYGKNCQLFCNPTEVIQVIFNILKNSYEAFNGTIGSIFIRTKRIEKTMEDGRSVYIVRAEFADNGPGIAQENLEKIFDKGFSTKGTHRGHGMYVIRELAEKNKGTVEVESPYDFAKFSPAFTTGVLVTLLFPSPGKL